MAIGDKYPVLMGTDKDVPDGVATLDAEGILKKSQRPNLAQVGGSNPNLLLNWDFRNPVNRNGKSEYNEIGYTIDLWESPTSYAVHSLRDDGINLSVLDGGNGYILQTIEKVLTRYAGKTVTLSVLTTDKLYTATGKVPSIIPTTNTAVVANINAQLTNSNASGLYVETNGRFLFRVGLSSGGNHTIQAVKVELGDTQTLARQLDDGTWEIIDPPNYAEQYALCAQYSPITGDFVGSQHSNPNLLDNWYFAGDSVIDQRQGYVVPPDTAYYSDTGLATQVGTVDAYTTAINVDGTYGTITVSSTTYYVPWSAAVRGYVGAGYTVDRWNNLTNRSSVVLVEDAYITQKKIKNSDYAQFSQFIENPKNLVGQTVTISALIRSTTTPFLLFFENDNTYGTGLAKKNVSKTDWTLISTTGTLGSVLTSLRYSIGFQSTNAVGDVEIKAVKLELGSVQTLARLDENGNWVLNDPPPNPATELAKCQRYYQLFSTAEKRPTTLTDYRPTMRANPTTGTINVNGQTLYYADANL